MDVGKLGVGKLRIYPLGLNPSLFSFAGELPHDALEM